MSSASFRTLGSPDSSASHRRRGIWFAVMFAVLSSLFSLSVAAVEGAADGPYVPDSLEPWTGWVLDDNPELRCASIDGGATGEKACAWPGQLTVRADSSGATFELRVWLSRSATVEVPGSTELWPHELETTGPALTLLATEDGRPAVELPAGVHRIRGRFEWDQMPSRLQVPRDIAHVDYIRAGEPVSRPTTENQSGETFDLYLRDGPSEAKPTDESTEEATENTVSLRIHRKLEDGVPLEVVTEMNLVVGGDRRTIQLGEILPAGGRPVSMKSMSPNLVIRRIEGREVDVYAASGEHRVRIRSVYATPPESMSVPKRAKSFYPPQEFWVWKANPDVRNVDLRGLDHISADQTTLPEDWRDGTTFIATPGDSLEMETTSRGVKPGPNALELHRDIFMLLEGSGFIVRDRVTGTMRQGWRLNYTGRGELGRVTDTADEELQLITKSPGESESTGVEYREKEVSLEAVLTTESGLSGSPFVGWNFEPQSMRASLKLPPGWALLYASGVDEIAAGSWYDDWSLWSMFALVLISLLIGRVVGWPWGVVAALALFGCHTTSSGPFWLWALVAGVIPLASVELTKPVETVVDVAWVVFAGFLCLYVATFAVGQTIEAVYQADGRLTAYYSGAAPAVPVSFTQQQAREIPDRFVDIRGVQQQDKRKAQVIGEGSKQAGAPQEAQKMRGSADVAGTSLQQKLQETQLKQKAVAQPPPDAVKQTGPGIPNRVGSSIELRWNGAVPRDHRVGLWFLAPWILSVLSLLHIALVLALAWRVLGKSGRALASRADSGIGNWGERLRTLMNADIVVALIALFAASAIMVGYPEEVSAQADRASYPPESLLSSLETRLKNAQFCSGDCLTVPRVEFDIDGTTLNARLEVHAQRAVGVPLPGTGDPLRLSRVGVDGAPSYRWRGADNAATLVRVESGRHEITYTGELPAGASRHRLRMNHGYGAPRHLGFESDTWVLEQGSLQSFDRPRDVITLVPEDGALPSGEQDDGGEGDSAEGVTRGRPEPWFQVTREVTFGLPWLVETTVRRGEANGSEVVTIPLLADETIMTSGLSAEDGSVSLEFSRGQQSRRFVSKLTERASLELSAPKDRAWTETWRVECGLVWHCDFSDLPTVQLFRDGRYVPSWKPHPGESLTVDVTRPEPVEGQSLTIESLDYSASLEQRTMEAVVQIAARASQRGKREVTLPDPAELRSLTVNGQERSNQSLDEGVLTVNMPEGESNVRIVWQQPWSALGIDQMPPLDLGGPVSNAMMSFEYGESVEPLVLAVDGPKRGTTSMLWLELIGLVVIAYVFGRFSGLPLRSWEWALLAAGCMLMTSYWVSVFIVFVCLMAFGLRGEWETLIEDGSAAAFNSIQALLGLLTLLAAAQIYEAGYANFFASAREIGNLGLGVIGDRGGAEFVWYVDSAGGELPRPWVLGVPTWVWRVFGVTWAGWLVWQLPGWAKWMWERAGRGGFLRRPTIHSRIWSSFAEPDEVVDQQVGDEESKETVDDETSDDEEERDGG